MTDDRTTLDDPTVIELDQFYPHPPQKVWRALTTPELMGQWMSPPVARPPLLIESLRDTVTSDSSRSWARYSGCEVARCRR